VGYLVIRHRRSASSVTFTGTGLAYIVAPDSQWSWFKHYYIEFLDVDTNLIMRIESPAPQAYLSPTGNDIAYRNTAGVFLIDTMQRQPPIQIWSDQVWSELWWSADGSHLAWKTEQDFILYHLDQKKVVRLEMDTAFPTSFAWSPTTSSIAIANQQGIHRFVLATGELTLILPATDRYVYRGLAWSPDEQQLAMQLNSADRYSHAQGLAIVEIDGRNFRQLTRNLPDSFPTWSPDGQSIAFIREDLLNLSLNDPKSIQYLTRGEHITEPFVWYPTSNQIAFRSVRRDECRTVKSLIPQDFDYVYCPETLKRVNTVDRTVSNLREPANETFWNLTWRSASPNGYDE
jgi:dipeptidyl aminopeptidase/acylaminoacyl peptidase